MVGRPRIELCEITSVEQVLSLWLKGAAQETYQQLSKDDVKEIKRALIKAYGFVRGFQTIYYAPPPSRRDHRWVPNGLATIGMTSWIKSAFINGLPSHVQGLLRSSTRLETLTLREVLKRARAVLVDNRDKHLASVAQPKLTSHTPNIHESGQSDVTYFRYGGPNHLARDCMQRSS